MGKNIRFGQRFVSGLLLLTIVWLVGCATATPPTRQLAATEPEGQSAEEPSAEAATTVVETQEVETEVPVVETPTVEVTAIPPLCPEELLLGEACVPYEEENPPIGDAELVPSYEPMRTGLRDLNPGVREALLDAHGLKINTARTVVLSEPVVLPEEGVSRYVPERHLAANSQLVPIRVSGAANSHGLRDSAWPGVGHEGNTLADCTVSSTYVTMEDNEDNAGTGLPDGDMGSWRVCVHSNDAAHPIEFNIDVPSLPPDLVDASLSLSTWDVDEQAPCPERDAVYFNGNSVGYLTGANDTLSISGLYPINPAWVQEGHNLVEIQVNTDGCLSSDGSERWCVAIEDASLVLEAGSCADLVETVAIAPIIPSDGEDIPEEMLDEPEGVVVDMLLLDTNVPESRVPSGAYLERARSDGEQGLVVELIDTGTGETVYEVDAEMQENEENQYPDFSAQIDLGTKTCRTCVGSWCVWRPCFFWE